MQPPEPVNDLDWSPARARGLGESVLDIWEELLARLRELPVGRASTADEVRAAVTRDVPAQPLPADELARYLHDVALEWSMYPGHPGFMAYISGAGTVPGAAADLLAAALNQNVGGWRLAPALTEIERHLTGWFAHRLGLPDRAGGLFTSGGAMATFVGLKAARDAMAGWDVRALGTHAGPPLALYASDEVHVVNDRAADMLGLGKDAVRHIPTDNALRMRTGALRDAIERDIAAGIRPLAVIATAGTVATGAIDPLPEIADLCREFALWLHVDGAYGGIAAMVDELRPLFAGIERANSIAFDPHKWLYTPHSGGVIVVSDLQRLHDAFAVHPTYIWEDPEYTRRGVDHVPMGPQFSRGSYAFKVWISLLAHGWDAYERRIAHDVALARYLERRAAARPEFETLAGGPLSIACFRYVPPDLPPSDDREAYLNRINERLMLDIQLHGRVFPSNAVIGGRFWLRACIVNFRTEAADLDVLLDVAAELGGKIDLDMRARAATT
ncbi:MAG: pyridoxal phosphate-dependent decarboxylase family protein [Longimicrobiales bacterium]